MTVSGDDQHTDNGTIRADCCQSQYQALLSLVQHSSLLLPKPANDCGWRN